MSYILKELAEKSKLAMRIRAVDLGKNIKLISVVLKHNLDKRNVKLDMTVRVGDTKYRLVDLESLFIVSPRYEEYMWNYLTPTEGNVFIDVGAHIGKYTLQIAKTVGAQGKVIAVEPDPDSFRALLEGIKLNKFSNVVALNVAAYDRECMLPLYVSPARGKTLEGWLIGKGWSSVKRKVSRSIHEVPAKRLDKIVDDLGISNVDYIKVDVEGAEYEVLKGCKKVLEKYKPRIIAECTLNEIAVLQFMKELGYTPKLVAPNYYFFKPRD